MDEITEVSSQNWFQRIGNAIKGIVFGFVLFIAAFPLLWWNEGRAVQTYKALAEGLSKVVHVESDKVDPSNDGKLVHINADAAVSGDVTDPDFGVQARAIRLERVVQMYQWKEKKESKTEKKLGGGEETVTKYSYSKQWDDDVINSGNFHQSQGHENPGVFPVSKWGKSADVVTAGAFTLPTLLITQMNWYEPVAGNADVSKVSAAWKERVKPEGSGFYLGVSPASSSGNPAIGDVKISFRAVNPGPISVVAVQRGSTFEAFHSSVGRDLSLVYQGTHTAQSMFKAEQDKNTMMTWILRFVGFIVMGIGLSVMLKPLSVLADVIPILGDIVEFGTGLIAFGVASVLSLVTIALAWLFYRPLLGILVLVVAVGISYAVRRMIKSGHEKRDPMAPIPV